MSSPTQMTLKYLRDNNYVAGIVERIIPRVMTKSDLFGWCDIVAVPTGLKWDAYRKLPGNKPLLVAPTVYVQTTTASNHASRRTKVLASPEARHVLAAGNAIWVVSWRQAGGKGTRWTARVEDITLPMFEDDPS